MYLSLNTALDLELGGMCIADDAKYIPNAGLYAGYSYNILKVTLFNFVFRITSELTILHAEVNKKLLNIDFA